MMKFSIFIHDRRIVIVKPSSSAKRFGLMALVHVAIFSWVCHSAEHARHPIAVEVKTPVETDHELAVERGHEAFYSYGCWHCHTLGDEEAPGFRDAFASGPDLANVGNRQTTDEILQSILDPNAVIAEPKEAHTENGLSKMPSFNDPAALGDIRDMVRFLEQCKTENPSKSHVLDVTDVSFQRSLQGVEGLVLLDFWAEWCFACYEANPALEAVAPQFGNRLKVFKIEVDENPVLVDKYVPDLMFPCFVILKDGKVLDRKYGLDKTMEAKAFFESWIGKFDAKAKGPSEK